jgi:hypothetical protein
MGEPARGYAPVVLAIAATEAEPLELGLEFLLLAVYGGACLIGGMVTALKGRWGWFCLGMLTGGLAWPLTALLIGKPDSPWGRSFYGPAKLARARRRFPRDPAAQRPPARG